MQENAYNVIEDQTLKRRRCNHGKNTRNGGSSGDGRSDLWGCSSGPSLRRGGGQGWGDDLRHSQIRRGAAREKSARSNQGQGGVREGEAPELGSRGRLRQGDSECGRPSG